jgi:hypothetical protein
MKDALLWEYDNIPDDVEITKEEYIRAVHEWYRGILVSYRRREIKNAAHHRWNEYLEKPKSEDDCGEVYTYFTLVREEYNG